MKCTQHDIMNVIESFPKWLKIIRSAVHHQREEKPRQKTKIDILRKEKCADISEIMRSSGSPRRGA